MTLQERLSAQIRAALEAAQGAGALPPFQLPDEIVVQRAKPEFGDFASPVAMGLAKSARMAPLQIANRIVEHLPRNNLIGQAEVAAPGFLNFRLAAGWLAKQVEQILAAGERFGSLELGQGKRAQVEFVSANPTGPLTVGRGRGACVGDCLARVLSAAGYDVTREYYFNDAGRQMDVLGQSVRLRYLQLLGQEIDFPEDYYQGEYITEIARDLRAEYGDALAATDDVAPFRDRAVSVITGSIRATLARMGIVFDVYFSEQSLTESGEIWTVLDALRERGYVYEAEGAVWFKATEFGAEKDRVLVRSSGEPTYRLPDIAYHRNKLERGFDYVVDVFGADHAVQYPDIAAALEVMGYDRAKIEVVVHQFVTLVRDGQAVKMSTRRANYVTLDDLMDEVGADVLRYFMLMRSLDSHLDFDLGLAVQQSDENPVYYVQYAHTRIAGVLRQARERGVDLAVAADVTLLEDPAELALIREMLRLEEVVGQVARQLAPHHLTYYAHDLATAFHTFYDRCPVLPPKQTDARLTQARLRLLAAAKLTLARTLDLIGVSAPEQM